MSTITNDVDKVHVGQRVMMHATNSGANKDFDRLCGKVVGFSPSELRVHLDKIPPSYTHISNPISFTLSYAWGFSVIDTEWDF